MRPDKKVQQKMHDEWQKWCRAKCGQEKNKEFYIPTHDNPLWEIWSASWSSAVDWCGRIHTHGYTKETYK